MFKAVEGSHVAQKSLHDEVEGGQEDGSLDERVYLALLDHIRSGHLPLGSRLPSENALAEDFGVSRPIVRVALARLRDEGLIVSRRGSGSYVTDGEPAQEEGFSPLGSIDDIAAWYAYRKMIESEAAALAATNATEEGLRDLRVMVENAEKVTVTGRYKLEEDMRFHLFVAGMSGNRFLFETVRLMRPHMQFVGRFVNSMSSPTAFASDAPFRKEHRELLKALEVRDPVRARALMAEHIEASEKRVFKGG
ncbi:MAG: FadR family transcriptional regulator [Rhodobacteraceae bacterium]|nr:FadR family transcriptional regulator [Paracoccaceae bacterium]